MAVSVNSSLLRHKQHAGLIRLLVTAAAAGLLYCSWPLGYVLNPLANRGLASNLAALGQPYNWVFAVLDVCSGLIIAGVAWWLLKLARQLRSGALQLAVVGYGLFGVLTTVDALLPEDCLVDQHACGALLNHPLVIWHGLASLGSITFLTLSILIIWRAVAFERQNPLLARLILQAVLTTWLGFGLLTAGLLLLERSSALSQHVFIVVCSLWTIAFPYFIWRLSRGQRRLVFKKIQIADFRR